MLISLPRRLALISVASGLVVAGVALGSAPVGAAPQRPAVPAAVKVLDASLTSVAEAPRSTTAWAFGNQSLSNSTGSSYAARRTGGHWSKLAVSDASTSKSQLFGIAAGSPKSAWIVGNLITSGQPKTLIEHSSGGAFKAVKTKLGQGQLLSVSASSPSNVWATGDGRLTPGPYIVHWNGKSWKALPTSKLVGYSFSHVSASGPKNVWFLGSGPLGLEAAVWNGHKLRVMALKVPSLTSLTAIATASPKNTWLIGTKQVGSETSPRSNVFTEHWNGHKWSAVKTPSPLFNDYPQSVTAAGSQAYVTGYGYPKSGVRTSSFILRYSHGKWKTVLRASNGAQTTLSGISVSTKGGAAVGTNNLRGICGVKHPTPNTPLVENLVGGSWHHGVAPRFRLGMARVSSFMPDVPAC